MTSMLIAFEQSEDFGAGGILAQAAPNGRGDGFRAGFLDAAHGQAQVFGFGDD